MPTKNITTLLFDLDGTLVDSAPDLALAVNKTLKELNLGEYSPETIRHWVGNGAKKLIEQALSCSFSVETELDPAQVTAALNVFMQHYQQSLCVESRLYDDVKTVLFALKQHGYRLAIITNKPEAFIRPIIDTFGIGDLFELLLGGDSLTERKPHPLPLYHACEQLNVSVAECLMIGDSKNDILAAKAAKMQSIGLTYGYNYGEDIKVYQPDWRLEKFADLLPLLI